MGSINLNLTRDILLLKILYFWIESKLFIGSKVVISKEVAIFILVKIIKPLFFPS